MTNPERKRVLVVDDEVPLLDSLVDALNEMGYEARGENTPRAGLSQVRSWDPDVAIVDVRMPEMDGTELAARILEFQPDLPIIMLTGHGTVRGAVEAMRKGVYDYLLKPFDLDEMDLTIQRALELRRLHRDVKVLAKALSQTNEKDNIVGESQGIRRLKESIAAVADTDSTVLVTGESGTGKELVARAIHATGARQERPFITVDCAAIPGTLLESELFGHARGAFTGAHRDRTGYFESASDGTVFLDEVGELELPLQKKLLRVLEDKTFSRAGENRRLTTKARVVAATNRDLQTEVKEGRFREDLFYRLKVIQIHIPPLRERMEDVPRLITHCLQLLNRKLNRSVRSVAPSAMDAFLAYTWPGNVRELINLLEQVLTFHNPKVLEAEHLPDHLCRSPREVPSMTFSDLKAKALDDASRSYFAALLRHYRGNVTRVAEHAETDRRHMHRLLQKMGLDPSAYRHG